MKYGVLARIPVKGDLKENCEKVFARIEKADLEACQLVYKPEKYTVEDAEIIRESAAKHNVEISAQFLGYYDTNCPSGVPGPCDPIVDFMHTVIVEDFGHRGLAAVLVGGSLDIARKRGWRVRPICTYVQRYLDSHGGYENVVVSPGPVARRRGA